MEVISITKQKLRSLKPIVLDQNIFSTEAQLYYLDYKEKKKILKVLHTFDADILSNKIYTIETLEKNKLYLPVSFCIPDYLVAIDERITSFTVPKIEGVNLSTLLNTKGIDYQTQIYYLKEIGNILEELATIREETPLKDIFLNDLHDSNFIIDTNKKLRVIDLDSCKIENNSPFIARFLSPISLLNESKKYKINSHGYVIADSNSDLYCYCIIILNYLYGSKVGNLNIDDFHMYLNYLEHIGVHQELIDIFSKILSEDPNENPCYYLDSITERQIQEAKKFAYVKFKSK